MKNFFIPGFGTTHDFYADLLQRVPDLIYVSNLSFTYEEVQATLCKAATGSEKINLGGWSLGALFAIRWAFENPAKTNALFLTGTTARFCASVGYENGIKEKTLQLMIRQLPRNPQAVMRKFYTAALAGVKNADDYIIRQWEAGLTVAALTNGLQALLAIDLLPQLAGITVPVTIYHGAQDAITPVSGARILVKRLPHAQLSEEAEGGHCLLLQYPVQTASCMCKAFGLSLGGI